MIVGDTSGRDEQNAARELGMKSMVLKLNCDIWTLPKSYESTCFNVLRMESIIQQCNVDKNIIADLLVLIVKLIVVENEAPYPFRAQPQYIPRFSLDIPQAPFYDGHVLALAHAAQAQ